MKLLSTVLIMLSFQAQASSTHTLPLDLDAFELNKVWQNYKKVNRNIRLETETQMAIKGGEKFLKWLNAINQANPSTQIFLTSPASQGGGIPISNPKKYGPKTIKAKFDALKNSVDPKTYAIVYGKGAYTTTMPTDKAKFIADGKAISRVFSEAVRWSSAIKPNIAYYSARKSRDIRGYYHLSNMQDLDTKLANFTSLDKNEKETIKTHLVGLCINTKGSKGKSTCESSLQKYIRLDKLVFFKNLYWKNSQKIWRSFFDISSPRTDVTWNASNSYIMSIPFANIKDAKIQRWLEDNVEDEFKRKNWDLDIEFKKKKLGMSYLRFKPNVTPNVSGGNIITMDANTNIEEYSVRWTIRHEFGHILRLPDCYFEFYDKEEELAVNYQLDVTDLMCSRAGKMNDRIYDELKRVYYKN